MWYLSVCFIFRNSNESKRIHGGVLDLANRNSDKCYYVQINVDDNENEKIALLSGQNKNTINIRICCFAFCCRL